MASGVGQALAQNPVNVPPLETITTRLAHLLGVVRQCHLELDVIGERVHGPVPQDLAKLTEPIGMHGLTLEMGNALQKLQERLSDLGRAL